jgi:alpha-D-ribose 1-methylphosphonate 5-triphosphate synthase subunit PhnH
VSGASLLTDRLDGPVSQSIFRVLLLTLSRPGLVMPLPIQGVGPSVIPLALAGVESTFAVVGDPAWERRVERATGAAVVDAADAALVALCPPVEEGTFDRLQKGSPLAPERAAKVALGCQALRAGQRGAITLSISGPGVRGSAVLAVDGLSPSIFRALRPEGLQFPRGVDVWLVDERDQITGIPRSSTIEVM